MDNKVIVASLLIVLLLVSYVPLGRELAIGGIPNAKTSYNPRWWYAASHVASRGDVELVDGVVQIGKLGSVENASSAIFRFSAPVIPFMSEAEGKAAKAFLLIKNPLPVPLKKDLILAPVFVDEDFAEGWTGINYASLTAEGGALTIVPGEGGWASVYRQTPTYSSNEYNFVELKVTEVQNTVFKLLMTVDGSQGLLTDINGENLHIKPGTYIYHISEDHQYGTPNLVVEATGKTGSVKVDSILIGRAAIKSFIILNNSTILEPRIFERIMLLPDYRPDRIPFDFNLLRPDNMLNITLDGSTMWKISSIIIYIEVETSQVEPVWHLYARPLYIAFLTACGVILIILIIFKFNLLRKLNRYRTTKTIAPPRGN